MNCYFAGKGGFDCLYPVDPHHLIPKGRIKDRFPFGANLDGTPAPRRSSPSIATQAILDDERNIIPCCRSHHDNWHWARFTVSRAELPAEVEEFAREYGLGWALDRQYGQRKVAA